MDTQVAIGLLETRIIALEAKVQQLEEKLEEQRREILSRTDPRLFDPHSR